MPLKSSPVLPPLLPNERKVLEFIVKYLAEKQVSPSYAEIQEAFGYRSIQSVQNYLRQLVRKGYLIVPRHLKRAIQVTPEAYHSMKAVSGSKSSERAEWEIPLLGKVAAGKGIEKWTHDEWVSLPPEWLPGRRKPDGVFALQVEGNSMIEEGIWEDDVVFIEKTSTPVEGKVMLVHIADEGYTIKKIFYDRQQRLMELRPSNSQLASRFLSEEVLRFEGRLIGVWRRYR